MVKRKQPKHVQGILLAGGIIFICASVYFLVNGIYTYVQQFGQKDWKVTTAKVISVDERRRSSGGTHNTRSHFTVYDIYYQYEADGNVYTGTIYESRDRSDYGDAFEIKYDPESPKDSTKYLEPAPGFVVSGVLGFVVFGTIGLRMASSARGKNKK